MEDLYAFQSGNEMFEDTHSLGRVLCFWVTGASVPAAVSPSPVPDDDAPTFAGVPRAPADVLGPEGPADAEGKKRGHSLFKQIYWTLISIVSKLTSKIHSWDSFWFPTTWSCSYLK